ncbi:hypothetical protein HDU86_003728 [Geranomyces michiganensis]|nr:hypothetical protein HDU86_003728 [Geranomyces michiganensis]
MSVTSKLAAGGDSHVHVQELSEKPSDSDKYTMENPIIKYQVAPELIKARSITEELNDLGKSLDQVTPRLRTGVEPPHPAQVSSPVAGGGGAASRASEIEQVANQLLVSRSPLTAAAAQSKAEGSGPDSRQLPASGRLAQMQAAKVVTGIKYVRPKAVAPAQVIGKPVDTTTTSSAARVSKPEPLANERIGNPTNLTSTSRVLGSDQAVDITASGLKLGATSDSRPGKVGISTATSSVNREDGLESLEGTISSKVTANITDGSGPEKLKNDKILDRAAQDNFSSEASGAVADNSTDSTATFIALGKSASKSSAREPDANGGLQPKSTAAVEGRSDTSADERTSEKVHDPAATCHTAEPGESALLPAETAGIKKAENTEILGSAGSRRSVTSSKVVNGPRPPPADFSEASAPTAIPPSLTISLSPDNLDKSLPPTPMPTVSPEKNSAPGVDMFSGQSTPLGGGSINSSSDAPVVVTLKRTAAGAFRQPFANFSAASSESSVDSISEPLQFTIHSPSSTIEVMRRTTKVVELEDLPTSRRGSILTSNGGTPAGRRPSLLGLIAFSEKDKEDVQPQPQWGLRAESLGSASSTPPGSRRGSVTANVTNVVPVARRSSIVKVPITPPTLPNFRFSNVPLRSKLGIAASPDAAILPIPQVRSPDTADSSSPASGAAKADDVSLTPSAGTVDHSRPVSDSGPSPTPNHSLPTTDNGSAPVPTVPNDIIMAGERLLLNARTAMGSHSYLSESDGRDSLVDLRGHHMDRSVSMNTLASIINGSNEDVTGLGIPVKVNGVDCRMSFRGNKLSCVDVRGEVTSLAKLDTNGSFQIMLPAGKMFGRYFALDMSRILVAGNIGSTITMFAIPPKALTGGVKFRAFVFDCANEVQGAAWSARLNFFACEGNFPQLEKRAFVMIDEEDEKPLLDLIRKYITPVLACVGKELTVQVRRRRIEAQIPDFKTINFAAKISSKVPVRDADTSWLLKGALSATAKIEDVLVLPSGGLMDPVELALAIVKAPLKNSAIVVLNAQMHRAGLVGMVKKILKT